MKKSLHVPVLAPDQKAMEDEFCLNSLLQRFSDTKNTGMCVGPTEPAWRGSCDAHLLPESTRREKVILRHKSFFGIFMARYPRTATVLSAVLLH